MCDREGLPSTNETRINEYLDLFVEGQVVVEIKAVSHQLTNDELAQMINYLKAVDASVGLLFTLDAENLNSGAYSLGRLQAGVSSG